MTNNVPDNKACCKHCQHEPGEYEHNFPCPTCVPPIYWTTEELRELDEWCRSHGE